MAPVRTGEADGAHATPPLGRKDPPLSILGLLVTVYAPAHPYKCTNCVQKGGPSGAVSLRRLTYSQGSSTRWEGLAVRASATERIEAEKPASTVLAL